eukprot:g6192.t1
MGRFETGDRDTTREPCPDRIIEDSAGDRLQGALYSARSRAPILGGNFAVWGGTFSCFDCSLQYIRRQDDHWNAIASGFLTGGVLAARGGWKAASRNAVIGGVLLAIIEGVAALLMRSASETPREMHMREKQMKERNQHFHETIGMAETIVFLGVARIQDQAVLATCYEKNVLNEEKKAYETALAAALDRAKTAYPGWRESRPLDSDDRASCESGILYTFADPQALCLLAVGIRDADYPERVAVQLLRELADKARNSQGDEVLLEAKSGSLSKPLRKLMTDMMRRSLLVQSSALALVSIFGIRTYNDAGAHDKTTEVREKAV